MRDQKYKEIIVLGMHRSGTSMVCGVINHLGVNLGEDYPGKQISNPLGHFEDGDFLLLNQEILAAAGGSWDHPPEEEAIIRQADYFHEKIRYLVNSKVQANQGNLWGWKDPRTSLLIELYLPHLRFPSFIWCQRDPEEIADSLGRRNKISKIDSLALINIYQQRIANFFIRNPNLPLITLNYQDLISHPEKWVNQLAVFLELDPGQEQLELATRFILPRYKIKKEKWVARWKYWGSLPSRAIRRFLG